MIQVKMIHVQAEIVAVAVVDEVAVKVDQTLLKLRVKIQQRHQPMIQKNPQHIAVDVAVAQLVKAWFRVKP